MTYFRLPCKFQNNPHFFSNQRSHNLDLIENKAERKEAIVDFYCFNMEMILAKKSESGSSIDVKRQILVAFLCDFASTISNHHIRTEILNVRHYFKCSFHDLDRNTEVKAACSHCMINKSIQVPSKSPPQDDSDFAISNSGSSMTFLSIPNWQEASDTTLCQSVVEFFLHESLNAPEQYKFSMRLVRDMLEGHGKNTASHSVDCYPESKKEVNDVGLQVFKYKVKPWPTFSARLCQYKRKSVNENEANPPSKQTFFGRELITQDKTVVMEIPTRALDDMLTDPRDGSIYLDS